MSQKHIYYIDYLRVISCIFVVYMHTAADALANVEETANWILINITVCFAFTAVPIFFLISGYLLLTSNKTRDYQWLVKKRLPHLCVPLITWSMIMIIWQMHIEKNTNFYTFIFKVGDALSTPVMNHLWFMYTIVAMYIISPLLFWGIKGLKHDNTIKYVIIIIMGVELYAIFQTLEYVFWGTSLQLDIVEKLQIFGGNLGVFILGYYLGSIKKISNVRLLLVGLALWGIISIGTCHVSFSEGTLNQSFQNQSQGWEILLACCVFLYFKQNFNIKFKKVFCIIKSLSALSLPIYLIHNLLRGIFIVNGIIPQSLMGIVGVTIINCILCIIFCKTLASVKYICYIFTGMSYEDACDSCNWIYTFRWLMAKYKGN